ncbi:Metallo-hydrolase/oxidoreductase [Biscogniauxia marginata]|nr:Metallo-hydrolase/oxidoreductase [Biscogniauxia marginata]
MRCPLVLNSSHPPNITDACATLRSTSQRPRPRNTAPSRLDIKLTHFLFLCRGLLVSQSRLMGPLFRLLLRNGPRPVPVKPYSRIASATGATVALSMAAYTCTVARRPSAEKTAVADAKAHHVTNWCGKTVKFRNPHPSHYDPKFLDFLGVFFKADDAPKTTSADEIVPVVKPHFLPARTSSPSLRATWLGHACYYVEYPSGLRVLFDPVFEDYCAPVPIPHLNRLTKRPCDIADIPFVDAVVISHSHYDHLSYPSIQEIRKSHPNAHFFVGLGLEKWFKQSGIRNVTEMDWWDEIEVTFTPEAAKSDEVTGVEADSASRQEPITATISCLPSQHASGRGMFDKNTTLWASWGVRSGTPPDSKTVWFAGDTGYRTVPKVPEGVNDFGPDYQELPVCPQFRQIGERLGSIDLGLIPIGAYAPRHVFSHMHANPFDSVEIFRDTKCKRAMAIHWATWKLTPEDPSEPPKLLRQALKRRGIAETGVFDICDVGESREF